MRRHNNVFFLMFVLLVGTSCFVNAGPSFLPKILGGGKKEYSPLIFFKVPKGQLAASDEMEQMVRDLEKELNVKVERMDVLRDRFARKLFSAVDIQMDYSGKLPLLYHRESRQTIYGTCRSKARVRAWAKGRLLSYSKQLDYSDTNMIDGSLPFTSDEDEEADELELQRQQQEEMERLEEAAMTDLQRRGKEAMKKRMEGQN